MMVPFDGTVPSPARVLVIDHDPEMRRLLESSMLGQGYVVEVAATGAAGLDQLIRQGADLVILEMALPDIDGKSVLRAIREWTGIPVLMLTARAGESEKIAALDCGANDCITKPFSIHELMARVRAHLRAQRNPTHGAAVFDDGWLRIDLARRKVTLGEAPVALTRKEYALLAILVRHAGRVLTQSYLLRELWGPTYAQETHYLRILVAKLRHKLGDDASAPRWIETQTGVGLRFILPDGA